MKLKVSLLILVLGYFNVLASGETTITVTHTNYVTAGCLPAGAASVLSDNNEGLTTGIPIVFVYGSSEETGIALPQLSFLQKKFLSTSTEEDAETTTRCVRNVCTTSKVQVKGEASASSVDIDYLSAAITTLYEGKTTTKTIYTCPTSPKSLFEAPKPTESITSTHVNPLITKPAISKAITTTIVPDLSAIETGSEFSDDYITDDSSFTSSVSKNGVDPAITLSDSYISEELSNTGTIEFSISDEYSEYPISEAELYTTGFDTIEPSATADIYSTTDSLPLSSSAWYPYYRNTSSSESYESTTLATSSTGSSRSLPRFLLKATSSTASSTSSKTLTSKSSSKTTSKSSSSTTSKTSSKSSSKASTTTSSSSSSATCANHNSKGYSTYSGDLFKMISNDSPPLVFARKELPLTIPSGVSTGSPFGTNKFYANLFLGSQTDMIWSYPYGMFWKKLGYYGFAVQHTIPSNRVYGSVDTNNPGVSSYYLNPTFIPELIFSSTTISKTSNYLRLSNMESMSVLASLSRSSSDTTNRVDIPIVQGMGFATGIYYGNFVAEIKSLIGVKTMVQETSSSLQSTTIKYRATLFNGVEWLIYVTKPSASTSFSLKVSDSNHIVGSKAVDGLIIQFSVAPSSSSKDTYLDEAAGMYVTDAKILGTVASGVSASYGFTYTTKGSSRSGKPIVYAFPHQIESLNSATAATSTGITLASTTKGTMEAFLTKTLFMSETLETSMQYLPWVQGMTSAPTYTSAQLSLIAKAATTEAAVDIAATVNSMNSNYFSGKVIDKYAYILLVVSDIIKDKTATASLLLQMKTAFKTFTSNKQYYPLMYDTKFFGVTSTASQGGDTGADYGSGYYNDHHFHYGYFVHAAAIVGYVDKKAGGTWASDNKAWVNSLIRDVANPSTSDTYFPVSRMFDWFHGHSWAAGLFASGDGKNEESSSEDYNFAYGMKLWGSVICDNSMESRGDLMLALMSRSMNKYFYYKSDNTVEPSQILPNKVSGILFENKIDYTTYFGSPSDHPEYVHGIHMLPITPASSLIRIPSYVKEEWTDQVSTFISKVNSGWTGILYLNKALYDASSSYSFFSSSSWSDTYLDNGQSRTWALAFSGGVKNSS
ncbi:uncharacterized protein PRCAT00003926001 [Priceomyces carsonii]|uniref:uncharacterized protein n=1 Tax=Priceomyces carsonii TaxID=28549 RepID=UPI002ED89E7C|nr:unnamed protein product [Priceomyces carsonii]